MNKRSLMAILLVLLVAAIMAPAALAGHPGEPVGTCPPPFELHHAGMHDHEDHDDAEHRHVGLDRDLNGDGYWCVNHVGPDGTIHVRVDNNLPLD